MFFSIIIILISLGFTSYQIYQYIKVSKKIIVT